MYLGYAREAEPQACVLDNNYVSGVMAVHETGYIFNCYHGFGDYEVKDNERFNTTPMAAAYVNPDGTSSRDSNTCYLTTADTSTCYDGSGGVFSFCNSGLDDGEEWCYDDCSDPDVCAHTIQMAGGPCEHEDATKPTIEEFTPR